LRLVGGRLVTLVFAFLLAGCAGTLPPRAIETPSSTLTAVVGTPLADIAAKGGLDPAATAAWPLPEAAFALDARIAAIEHATTSIDLQTYLVADDTTGRQILRALRDAAARGVRVRLLVDDIYTAGLDPLLLAFASHPNVEVRLFNPFAAGRSSTLHRLAVLLSDFQRLDHRMHNKLFVADGVLAIAGGRNVADEYFLRSKIGNFFDIDVVLVGAIVPLLSASFDRYWNSEQAYDVHSIVATPPVLDDRPPADERAAFERSTAPAAAPLPPPVADLFGAPPLSAQLASGRFRLVRVAAASAYADPPDKASAMPPEMLQTLADRYLARLGEAEHELVLFSPYFVPGPAMTARLHELRGRGVAVRVITNSLAVSDEPLTSIALERHQRDLLAIGVELHELSTEQLRMDPRLHTLLGSSIGRLHAKIGLVDRSVVYVGSLNLDYRSARINTELGVRLESAELAAMIFTAFRIEEATGVVRVQLGADGRLAWSVLDENGEEQVLDHEPDSSWWRRLRVRLLALIVPEHEL